MPLQNRKKELIIKATKEELKIGAKKKFPKIK